MKLLISILSIAFFALFFSSCKKAEGPGGSSTIIGKVRVEKYDAAGNLLSEYYIPEEDVYIIYGTEGVSFNDDVKTSYDGTFRFDFLEKGTYQVFAYEKDINQPSGKKVIIKTVEITKKKSTVDVGTIIIRK